MSFYLDDTIAAISTPIGEGGIGIVRVSGKDAIPLVEKIFLSQKGKRLSDAPSHSISYGFIIDPFDNKKIDEVLVSVMRSPYTYTREDTVEINCHGGVIPLRKILQLVLKVGARIAEPGEFTKRAFLNGRIDLSQAEAVIDIIKAKTDIAERLALNQLEGGLSRKISDISNRLTNIYTYIEASIDFPEEEIEVLPKETIIHSLKDIEAELKKLSNSYEEGKLFKEGVSAVIVGKPNVGKSSLLNALLQKDRAIVTDIPGTTRDVIEDYINIKGLPLRIMDTAGIRETHDLAEIEGVKRSLRAIEGADIVLAVFDASRSIDNADIELIEKVKDKKTIFVINKSDIESPEFISSHKILLKEGEKVIKISVLKEKGIEELKDAIYREYLSPDKSYGRDDILLINIRHKEAIDRSLDSLKKSLSILVEGFPLEIAALYLRESLDNLGQITGVVTTEDILTKIFSEFCIGK